VVEEGEGPVACARCGELPEQVVLVVETVVEGVDYDAEASWDAMVAREGTSAAGGAAPRSPTK
jgi:hypothetical protein